MDIIREDFFHFLWQNLHFSQCGLQTTCGKDIRIIHPGYRNDGDGADYRLSRIRLGGMLFCGDVELHKSASEWYRHGHQRDSRYERVILHVVIRDDLNRRNVLASDGNRIPTVEMHSSLPASLNRLWRAWHRPIELTCSGLIADVPRSKFDAVMRSWDGQYFRYRLDRMLALFPSDLPINTAWQQMLIRGVFQGLGYHKNQENMLRLANVFLASEWYSELSGNSTSESMARRLQKQNQHPVYKRDIDPCPDFSQDAALKPALIHSTGRHLLEMAGLISSSKNILCRSDWDFSGSRPANQPSVRVPQAAELALRLARLSAADWLRMPAAVIWQRTSLLQESPVPGRDRRETIFQNVIVPSAYLLGHWIHDKKACRQAREYWTQQRIPLPEKVQTLFENGGFPPGAHLNRLATLHQLKYYCRAKRCYECGVMKYLAQT